MENYTGKRLDGRYEIQEVIGVGGMAVVYKAYDNIDDRIVAVKILKDEFLANEEFRRRFKNESKAISLLSHPNIVKVYNVNYGDRLQYIVMEYVEGITLKEYIEQQGHLGIKETIHFTTQILRALQHAHDKGIIHRDIKPQNILLLSNGNIKVTDFGIARFSYSDTKTMTDSAIGSVHYISPEQAKGDSIDERTDVYSVGVVMYEMLTGKLPFVSDNSVSVALMQLQSDARSIREINPNIPIGLEQIVKRSMSKDTKSRYQTASEMLLDIEEFKRNPNIQFQHNYFIDTEPTKFAQKSNERAAAPVRMPPEQQVPIVLPGDGDDDDDDGAPRGRAGFIVVGILIGLIVVGLGVFAALYFFTDTFNPQYETVPNFIGMNYEQEIKDKFPALSIEVILEANDLYEDGIVFNQDPAAGRNFVSANKDVKIYVVDNDKPITVPDVTGMNWEKAKIKLEDLGFTTNLLPIPSAVVDYGNVIKTAPAADTEASLDQIITIYYASDDELIEVPNIIGDQVTFATEKLESMQLAIVTDYEQVNSDKPKGTIISQNPEEGDKVMPGTRVQIVVSNGVPSQMTATVTIRLPNEGNAQSFNVYVNNESKITNSILMDGTDYSFTIEGSDSNVPVKVLINGSLYYSCNVDFTKNPAVISNSVYALTGNSSPVASQTLPSVIGLSEEAARMQLASAGFKNVKVTYAETLDVDKNGKVTAQNPASPSGITSLTGGDKIPVDTEITLTVGQFPGV
ncbi:MAG: Stk1 family PASTA domain-containing Ser/Thr kinase [Clostridia bacterium]|nr:Stk1 family PASTA domain-containing Ser/Thr kinase [Clostridia bacterium]